VTLWRTCARAIKRKNIHGGKEKCGFFVFHGLASSSKQHLTKYFFTAPLGALMGNLGLIFG
jgi:hypothetical protein